MDLTLQRSKVGLYGVFGAMAGASGPTFMTLEHAYFEDGKWFPKIPAGTYTCELRQSPHFGYPVYMLLGVQDHDFIEIHIANWESDLNGCIGVGLASGTNCILQSRDAFNELMAIQAGAKTFQLTILDITGP